MTAISLNDIKYDLLKIIEPHDGWLSPGKTKPVRKLFIQYLLDLQHSNLIHDFNIETADRGSTMTFELAIRLAYGRAPKSLKIHVGVYEHA